MHNTGFFLYLLFVVSWFTHLTSRLAILGVIRFDLVLEPDRLVCYSLLKTAERRQTMLPEIRQTDYLYEVPKFELDRNDIIGFAEELKGFHENFVDCFHRSESRGNFFDTCPVC
jgi:hypothetical protein